MTGREGNSEFCFPRIAMVSPSRSFAIMNPFSRIMNAVSNAKRRPTSIAFFNIRLTGTQICRGFKEHDLITCKSKVHVVVSLGS